MMDDTKKMITFEYGAMSSLYSLEAENKLTAYCAMIGHYTTSAHMLVVYEPKDLVKDDNWTDFSGQISARLDEIFGGAGSFDKYYSENIALIKAAYSSKKRLS